MELWSVSSFVPKDGQKLVEEGFLRPNVDPNQPEWIVPGDEREPVCPPGYVVTLPDFTSVDSGHRRINSSAGSFTTTSSNCRT
jgi:hypothetical protein